MTALTDTIAGLALAELAEDAAGEAVALSAEAGWNQNAADWRHMIANGRAFCLRGEDGGLPATALVQPYGDAFAWIGMVLVTRDYQRRGIATELMSRCIDDIEARGLVPGLDATPAGRQVYKPLGFEEVYGLRRLQASEPGWSAPVAIPAGVTVRRLTAEDLPSINEMDRTSFGGDRSALLANLLERRPDDAWIADAGSGPVGYVLAREGRENHQVGPLVAAGGDIALALLDHALAPVEGAVYIDVAEHHETMLAWLAARGFSSQRPFTRMLKGRSEPFDDRDRIFAIAGPELG